MGITIPYFFGLRMGVGMGMVFIYNQLLISEKNIKKYQFSHLNVLRQNFHKFNGQKMRLMRSSETLQKLIKNFTQISAKSSL
jgi:hypothetical protein